MPLRLDRDQYTVGWVCALAIELVAAQVMLDEEHETPLCDAHDTNIYSCGQIGEHNIVIACLPEGRMGTTSAATVANQMRFSFTSIGFGLMVGIGGGVPSDTADIRLGDVVVSKPDKIHGGVVQYDFGKALADGFERTGSLDGPPTVLLNAVTKLRAKLIRHQGVMLERLSKFDDLPDFTREAAGIDVLYLAHYEHAGGVTCKECDASQTKSRPTRKNDTIIHYGTIASGNEVMKNSTQRDSISAKLGGVLCFEMEAAGLMNNFPCLVVRGMSDYANSHKNDQWQPFAAATAATYARELLSVIPAIELNNTSTAQAIITANGDQRPIAIRNHSVMQLPWPKDEPNRPEFTPAAMECLRSLAFPEQEQRFLSVKTAQHTCQWLLEDSQYQAWLASPRGLFLIKGHPGTGKSVLMKFAVNSLRKERPKDLIAAFFVHGQGNTLQRSALGICRALLNSLLEQFPECLSEVTALFEERNKRWGDYEAGRWEWNVDELYDKLSQVLTGHSSKISVSIFIDALDECGEEVAKDLLTYFNDQTNNDNARVKVCISSRHYPVIGLEDSPAVYMEERNAADISWYVRDRLKSIQSAHRRDLFEHNILRKAEGGFQWAFLVTGIMIDGNMNGVKIDKLQNKLASCPGGLGELYSAILKDVTGSEQQQMNKLFEWILFAGRPLSAQELREALATDKNMDFGTISELREHDSWSDTLDDFEKYVKGLSKGLVEFKTRDLWEVYDSEEEDWSREAQLIHQSVADFLIDRSLKRDSGKESDESPALRGAIHFRISRSCLQYMFIDEILDAARLSRATLSSRYPLISYVIRYVFEHMRKVEIGGIAQIDLLAALHWGPRSPIIRKVATLWKILDPGRMHAPLGWPFFDATALHLLVACGSRSACSARLETSNEEVDCLDANGNTPLMLAIRDGHQAIALMLVDECNKQRFNHVANGNSNLSNKFQIARRTIGSVLSPGEVGATSHSGDCFHTKTRRTRTVGDLEAANDDGDTALTIALEEQNSEVTIRLIQAGVKLEYLGDPSALVRIAISSRDKALINILITNGVSLNGAMYYLLDDETVGDHCGLSDLVCQLLQAGADCVNSLRHQQSSNSTEPLDDYHALILAARKGLSEIVQLLISHGASPMVQNMRGDTALMAAVQDHRREVVQLLLELAPTSVNVEDNVGHTPLQAAFQMRDFELVGMILSRGDSSDTKRTNNYLLLGASEHSLTNLAARMLQEPATDPDCKDVNGRTPLFIAAISGCDAIVNMLLETPGVTLDLRDGDERTPLMEAVFYGHSKVVEILLDHGADPSSVSRDGSFPLFEAACENNSEMVKLLLAKGADIDYCGERGTALAGALSGGNYESVELLIRNGADVNAEIPGMGSILHYAIFQEKKNMVRLLIQHGADVNARDWTSFTPLDRAMRSQDKEMVKLLLQKGADVNDDAAAISSASKDMDADVNARDETRLTPLHSAIRSRCEEMVKLLLQKGAVVNDDAAVISSALKDVDELTKAWEKSASLNRRKNADARRQRTEDLEAHNDELFEADELSYAELKDLEAEFKEKENKLKIQEEREECKDYVENVFGKLYDASYTADEGGWYSMHWASEQGHAAIVQFLLDKGAYSGPSEDGSTPLHVAAQRGHQEVVRALLSAGLDMGSVNSHGWTPLLTACSYGQTGVVRLLLDSGPCHTPETEEFTPLQVAAATGHLAVVNLLLARGADFRADNEGLTPLHVAAEEGHADIVQSLLNAGADHTTSTVGRTPLFLAALWGHTDIVELLLDTGADHTPEIKGYTPLHAAAEEGHEDTVILMLERGAESTAAEDNATPLHLAATGGHVRIVKVLLDHGVVIKTYDNDWTPLHAAAANGSVDVAELLLNAGADANAMDRDGVIPLIVAANSGHLNMFEFLIDKGAHLLHGLPRLLELAKSNGDFRMIKFLLLTESLEGESTVIGIHGGIANWLAALGQTDLLKLIVDQRDAQLDGTDFNGRNALQLAVRSGQQDTFQYLETKSLQLATTNMQGLNLIEFAASGGSEELLALILEMYPNIGYHGGCWSPLHWACRAGRVEAIELLLARGWSTQITNVPELSGNWTPYSIAVYHGNEEVVEGLPALTKIALGLTGSETEGTLCGGASCDGCLHASDAFNAPR